MKSQKTRKSVRCLPNQIKVPHPFPYQGSKRGIAKFILPYFPPNVDCLIEPFCGSGAISIAALANGLVKRVILNDLNESLIKLWSEIIQRPDMLCDKYETLWIEQQMKDKKAFFFEVRDKFNENHDPHLLLYLLARIVKGSVRYCSNGNFNQSPDNRRLGMKPSTMRKNLLRVASLMGGKTSLSATDFRHTLDKIGEHDLVYMDPPYQGTSFTRDHRYLNGVTYEEFIQVLSTMNDQNISYIISYDGKTGLKSHGKLLPKKLHLKHLYVQAGRSSQATLLGSSQETLESLYLSPSLVERLEKDKASNFQVDPFEQQQLSFYE